MHDNCPSVLDLSDEVPGNSTNLNEISKINVGQPEIISYFANLSNCQAHLEPN